MIFVHKGMKPLTSQQLDRRTQKYIDRDFPQWKRERSIRKSDGEFDAYMDVVEADTDINRANNEFNWNLEQYRKAVKRLNQYELSVGKPESSYEHSTGEFSEEGVEVTETITVDAIEPLEATLTVDVYDLDGSVTGTETVDNPEVVNDAAERAQAQYVVDNASEEVVNFDAA